MAQTRLMRLVRELQKQGCRVKATKAGFFVFCPDGHTTFGFHTSNPSDKRTLKNIRASVLRAGLQWPEGITP